MAKKLPPIYPSPYDEGYRRAVLADYGIDPGIAMGLPALPTWRPDRAAVAGVLGDFAYTNLDGENSDWQSYKYCGWPLEKRRAFRVLMREIGARTAWIAPTVTYQEVSVDCRRPELRQHFVRCVTELLDAQIVPFVQIAQPETYGVKSWPGIARAIEDLNQWQEWGWADVVNGLGVNVWPESNADTTPGQLITLATAIRRVLPESYIGIHPGRTEYEGLIYQGDDAEGYDRERFWREIGPLVDALLWEARTDVFRQPDWRRALFVDVAGAVSRLSRAIEPGEAYARAQTVGLTLTDADIHGITRMGHTIAGAKVDVCFWEGPEYDVRWSSPRKAEAAAIALAAGASGSLVGVPSHDDEEEAA